MKQLLQNSAVFCTVLLLALLLAEIASRFLLPAPQKVISSVVEKNYAERAQQEHKKLTLNSHPDEGGLYRGSKTGRRLRRNRSVLIENHRLSQQSVLIETNNLGYRNKEIQTKIKGSMRFLFLGDSITFADYLNEAQTFVRQIEQKAHQAGKDWETINAGVGSISLKNELAILMETGLSLAPDVVVLNFYLNDFQPSRGIKVLKLPIWLERSYFLYYLNQYISFWKADDSSYEEIELDVWRAEFIDEHQLSEGHFNQSPETFNTMLINSFSDTGASWGKGAWAYMTPLFEEFSHLSKQNNFKLIFIIHPTYQQIYSGFDTAYPQRQLKEIGRSLNIPVLDLLPLLQQEAINIGGEAVLQGRQLHADLLYDQCHHTPKGSAIVAQAMYQFLSDHIQ